MSQRTMLGIAAALSAFLLIIVGSVIGQITNQPTLQTPQPTSDPLAQVEPVIQQREAAYQEQLRLANERIQQANQQLQQAQQQINQLNQEKQTLAQQAVAQPANTNPVMSNQTIGAEQALALAQSVVPQGTLLRQPELVNFQGAVAYEVTFDLGNLYIQAHDGTILFNGTAPTAGFGEREEHEEHEEHDHHGGGEDDDD